jgi:hypothetical protein
MPRIQNPDLAKPTVICQAEEAHILALSTKLETLWPASPFKKDARRFRAGSSLQLQIPFLSRGDWRLHDV